MKKSYSVLPLFLIFLSSLITAKLFAQDDAFNEKHNTYEYQISQLKENNQLKDALKIYKLMLALTLRFGIGGC